MNGLVSLALTLLLAVAAGLIVNGGAIMSLEGGSTA